MVGKRRNILNSNYSNGNVNSRGDPNQFNKYQRVDLESGYGSIRSAKPTKRFRDAIDQTVKDNRANEMKQKLIDNIDHEALEIYRKSDESVC
jgi:hypothetical protein